MQERPMQRDLSIGLIGNVNTQPFGKLAPKLSPLVNVSIDHLPQLQVEATLRGDISFDILIVHLDHRWFFDVAPSASSVQRAEDFVALVHERLARASGIIILNTVPFIPASLVASDLHDQIETLAQINSVFFRASLVSEQISVIDAAGTLAMIGFNASIRERNRYLYQLPYSPIAAEALTDRYAEVVLTYLRSRRKVIVVDADNTLWGGILGEDGIDNLVIDLDYPGIIHYRFQQQLERLQKFGIILCAVTKNNEEDFVEMLQSRKMPIGLNNFVSYRSNWLEKSDNIKDLAKSLNLGLDSFVFIDDNPFEIEEVRARCFGVECHLFDRSAPEKVFNLLDNIVSLQSRSITDEDRAKTEQYQTEASRAILQRSSTTLNDYLFSLDLQMHVTVNNPGGLRRITQLVNKTNQFNLTTRRYTEDEIASAMTEGSVYGFRVVDRFGDMGIVGAAVVRQGEIEAFLMSCRALGRKIESQMLRYICERERDTALHATFRPTKKNHMVENFYEDNGFELISSSEDVKAYKMNQGPDGTDYVKIFTA